MRHGSAWHRWAPEDVRRVHITEQKKAGEYLVVDSQRALVSLVQGDIVEIHCWNSTMENVEHPDRLAFDLDPGAGIEWRRVVEAAFVLRERLRSVGRESWPKLTGGKGVHVVVPCAPEMTWARGKAERGRLDADSVGGARSRALSGCVHGRERGAADRGSRRCVGRILGVPAATRRRKRSELAERGRPRPPLIGNARRSRARHRDVHGKKSVDAKSHVPQAAQCSVLHCECRAHVFVQRLKAARGPHAFRRTCSRRRLNRMSRRGLWAVGGALVVALLGGACTSEDASEGDKCTPGDRQPCTCDSGADGTQTCNAEGSGFSLCDCGGGTGGTSGTGGGGTGGGGTGGGGTGGGGTGGAVGDAGGTDGGLTDASMGGSDASTGGTGTDASTGGTGGSPTDGGCGAVPDAGDVCVNCVAQNCCAELDACSAPGNTCLTPTGGDAAVAFSDYECVDYCIYLSAQDGGAANLAVANDCVTSCGANNETRSLFQCIFGQGGGTDCISECY